MVKGGEVGSAYDEREMSTAATRLSVLVIEDDDSIADVVVAVAAKAGYRGRRAADGREGLKQFFEDRADLVILDVGLPQLDGWEVLSRLRDLSDVPVLMLTARGLERDKVRGLLGGADDYLAKPFGIAELGARIEALLRRSSITQQLQHEETYSDGSLRVNWSAREVFLDDEMIDLSPLEFRLLESFIRHPGQALSNEQLLQLAWSDPLAISPERVKFVVMRLRRKLDWDGDGSPIETVRGFGYRYRRSDL